MLSLNLRNSDIYYTKYQKYFKIMLLFQLNDESEIIFRLTKEFLITEG